MITIEQIKAARSLLNWNQQMLSDAVSISKTALANIERGATSPRTETMQSIKSALEEGGVEFIEGPGVRLKSDILQVQVFKGEDSIVRLWKDLYQTLDEGDERLVSGVDENKFSQATGKHFFEIIDRYQRKGLRGRILSLEGDMNFPDDTAEYRWVDEVRFLDVTYYIYANKYAMILWEPTPRVILIENKVIADNYRDQFNRVWERAKIPPKKG